MTRRCLRKNSEWWRADVRTKANHHFNFRAMGAVTAHDHGSFVARTIPEWNRLPAAAADAVSPTSFHSRLNALPVNFWPGGLLRRRLHIICAIRRWPSFDSRQKAVLQSTNKTEDHELQTTDTVPPHGPFINIGTWLHYG